jgi:hypothetical protein
LPDFTVAEVTVSAIAPIPALPPAQFERIEWSQEVSVMPDPVVAVVIRIGSPGAAAFQLRKGEEGLSVFDPIAVEPHLSDEEILDAFRPGSILVYRTVEQIASIGLTIVATDGFESLPERLRIAHREVRPAPSMSRSQFKDALKELE